MKSLSKNIWNVFIFSILIKLAQNKQKIHMDYRRSFSLKKTCYNVFSPTSLFFKLKNEATRIKYIFFSFIINKSNLNPHFLTKCTVYHWDSILQSEGNKKTNFYVCFSFVFTFEMGKSDVFAAEAFHILYTVYNNGSSEYVT